jgi:hypothetical protein
MLAKHPRGLPKDLEEGFGLLDADGGAGWDLAAQLVSVTHAEREKWANCCGGVYRPGCVCLRSLPLCCALPSPPPLCQVAYNPDDRPTASQALVHPYITNSPIMPASLSPAGTGTVSVMAQTGATAAAAAARSLSSTVGTVSKKVTEALPAGTRMCLC